MTADAEAPEPVPSELLAELERLKAENAALRSKIGAVKAAALETGPDAVAQAQAAARSAQELLLTSAPTAEQLEANVAWPKAGDDLFWERPARSDPTVAASLAALVPAAPAPPRDPASQHVVHLTAELAPIAKVGGLGDVVTGLARACALRGHNVEVIMPFYECMPEDQIEDLRHEMFFGVPKGREWEGEMQMGELKTNAWRGRIANIECILLRPDWNTSNIFRGGRVYGGSYNELEAYLYFCRAALEYCKVSGRQPNVIHLHEWQTSAAAMLYWDVYYGQGLNQAKVMLTIHNMDNKGECRADEFLATGVDGEPYNVAEKALDERTIGHNPERMSLLKGGIVYSNAVTTVSPTYAKETLTGGAAGWLDEVLTQYKTKYHGVLNGIDTEIWDPAVDPLLPANFAVGAMAGKALCKKYLQRGLGLQENPDKPLVVCISRLVPQKGIHLIRHAIKTTAENNGQFVLLGSGHAEGDFISLANEEYARSKDVSLKIMYSDALSHLMYAGADCVLVPSMFEPCGLTQMIAFRYGALPIVRRTGGLADTVMDVDEELVLPEQRNGFVFDGIDEGSLDGALGRALKYYVTKKEWWADMQQQVMAIDNTWHRAAGKYVELYTGL